MGLQKKLFLVARWRIFSGTAAKSHVFIITASEKFQEELFCYHCSAAAAQDGVGYV
jgi:hypothetical protein